MAIIKAFVEHVILPVVLYYSRTGNTKLLAESIAEGVKSIEDVSVLLKNTEEVTKADFIDSKGIIIG